MEKRSNNNTGKQAHKNGLNIYLYVGWYIFFGSNRGWSICKYYEFIKVSNVDASEIILKVVVFSNTIKIITFLKKSDNFLSLNNASSSKSQH